MKSITYFINEALLKEANESTEVNEANESIKSEEDFKKYAKTQFEEAFGDDLDEDKMNETIDGILKDYAEDAENGDWGKLVGVLNKSF